MDRLRHACACAFGTTASAYAQHRPDDAPAAVQWALERAPGRRVLDLGAGTGTLTAALVTSGACATAVEPDAAMLTELQRALPDVRALPGSAEAVPLPDASVDAVVAGNALHWFDMGVAGPEIARVLAPRGVLSGLWNVVDDRVDRVAGLAEVSGSACFGPRDTRSSWRAATAGLLGPGRRPVRPGRGGRAPARAAPYRRLAGGDAGDQGGVLVLPPAERTAQLAGVRAYLASRPETVHGEFVLPMLTCVLRTQRS